ncbi:MAG: hypothetical protein WC501_01980 [Candidatus Micrarchaeia archaeon]
MKKLRQNSPLRIRINSIDGFKRMGIPLEEAVRIASQEGLIIASNRSIDEEFMLGVSQIIHCRTGTLVASNEPGDKLGLDVVSEDFITGFKWVFPVPYQFVGEQNLVLVTEYPYSIEKDGNYRVINPLNKIDYILGSPSEDFVFKYYQVDVEYYLPSIISRSPLLDKRVLVGSYNTISAVMRTSYDWNHIIIGCPLSYPSGLIVKPLKSGNEGFSPDPAHDNLRVSLQ